MTTPSHASATTSLDRADTRDMLGVHQVFRDAFGCAAQFVGAATGDDDPDRVALVASYYANVLAFLHAHHEGEDELVWPSLLERAPEQGDMIRRVAGQHANVLESLKAAEIRLADWVADPGIERGTALAVALATLGVELGAHLDEEERLILPLAAEHFTTAEWGRLPEHGMRAFAGDKPWLVIGLIQEQMPPEAVAVMETHMPPPVRDFWVGAGRAQFTAFVTALRS